MNLYKRQILSLFLLISFSVFGQTDCWTTDITNTLNNPDVSDEVKDLISGTDGWDLYEAMHKSGKSYDILHNASPYNYLQNLRNNDLLGFEGKLLSGLTDNYFLNFINQTIPIEDIRSIDNYLNRFASKSIINVIDDISINQSFNNWRTKVIAEAGGRSKLRKILNDFGYTHSSNAVADASNVGLRNQSKLSQDIDAIPNAVDDYSYTIDGVTYTKAPSETWKDYFTRLKNTSPLNGFESHHIFPVTLFKKESFRKWYEAYGRNIFNINGEDTLENLIMLEKKTGGRGVHANHPAYTERIGEYFDTKFNGYITSGFSESEALNLLTDDILNLVENLKTTLLNNSVKGNLDVNNYWAAGNINFDSLID